MMIYASRERERQTERGREIERVPQSRSMYPAGGFAADGLCFLSSSLLLSRLELSDTKVYEP